MLLGLLPFADAIVLCADADKEEIKEDTLSYNGVSIFGIDIGGVVATVAVVDTGKLTWCVLLLTDFITFEYISLYMAFKDGSEILLSFFFNWGGSCSYDGVALEGVTYAELVAISSGETDTDVEEEPSLDVFLRLFTGTNSPRCIASRNSFFVLLGALPG